LPQGHIPIDASNRQTVVTHREYLEMRLQGKRGMRKSKFRPEAIAIFERVVKRGNLQPDDLLSAEHHRDGFRELLIAAGLRSAGRNLKCPLSTGLMLTILRNPRINLKLLAENAGTSVAMLDQFYLKRLTVDMDVAELV
jgi:hypothetical protein